MDHGLTHHVMLGMRVDYAPVETFLEKFVAQAQTGQPGYMCVSNVHQCILTYDDSAFRDVVNGADFVMPDSVILERARAWRFGVDAQPIQRGADLMLDICALAEAKNLPVALIGGRDDTVLHQLKERLHADFPNLNVAYAFSPPFSGMSAEEDAQMVRDIVDSGAKIVLVGLGCPKQERWMAEHKDRLPAMQAGVGAAFDFNAGLVKPSPEWVHRSGLEWLYRLLSEPRRLWKRYLSTSPRFVFLVLAEAFRSRTSGSSVTNPG